MEVGMFVQASGKLTLSQSTNCYSSQTNSRNHDTFTDYEKVNTVGVQNPSKQIWFTCSGPTPGGITMYFSRIPKHGDVFRSQQIDNVLYLGYLPNGDSLEPDGLVGVDLYRIHEKNGVPTIERMGFDILTVYEESYTATYYLPDKDVAVHFPSPPKEGDIFCRQGYDNMLVLVKVPKRCTLEFLSTDPHEMELFRVQKEPTGFLLLRMDESKNPPEEISPISVASLEDNNSTFTCFLYTGMVLHFNRLPTHGDIFMSHRKKNIMLLDVLPEVDYRVRRSPPRSYGSPLDIVVYRVQQIDDGFQLVKVASDELWGTVEALEGLLIRRELKIRRHVGSNKSPDEDNKCSVCLAAYKEFDRIGSVECGHEFHVSCIVPFIRQNNCCPICKKKVMVEILEPPEASFKT